MIMRIVNNILILLVSICVGLLICEFLVQILPISRFDKTRSGIFRSHLTRVFELIPNVSTKRWGNIDWNINSKGFRDYEHSIKKNNFRILGIGDSFFAGHEVSFENSFLRQLEKNTNIEIIKMAVGCYGTGQERLLWEEGKIYKPDIVLLGIYVGNDLLDNVWFPQSGRMIHYFASRSLLARLLMQRFRQYFPQTTAKEPRTAIESDPIFKNAIEHQTICNIYDATWSDSVKEGFELLKENVSLINLGAKGEGSILVVIVIPTEIQIYDWLWGAYLKKYGNNGHKYDRYKVINSITDYLEEKNIRYINLLPVLQEAGRTDKNLHPGHWHWSIKANKLVADTVKDYLKKNKLIFKKSD